MKSVGWTVAVIVLAVGTGVWMSRRPWIEATRQKTETGRAVGEMDSAQADRARLAREAAMLERPAVRESVARERGYKKPDEVPVEEVK